MNEPNTAGSVVKSLPRKSPGGGWTIISPPRPSRGMSVLETDEDYDPEVDAEHNDLDNENAPQLDERSGLNNRRIREGKEAIKYDIEDIVNGMLTLWSI